MRFGKISTVAVGVLTVLAVGLTPGISSASEGHHRHHHAAPPCANLPSDGSLVTLGVNSSVAANGGVVKFSGNLSYGAHCPLAGQWVGLYKVMDGSMGLDGSMGAMTDHGDPANGGGESISWARTTANGNFSLRYTVHGTSGYCEMFVAYYRGFGDFQPAESAGHVMTRVA